MNKCVSYLPDNEIRFVRPEPGWFNGYRLNIYTWFSMPLSYFVVEWCNDCFDNRNVTLNRSVLCPFTLHHPRLVIDVECPSLGSHSIFLHNGTHNPSLDFSPGSRPLNCSSYYTRLIQIYRTIAPYTCTLFVLIKNSRNSRTLHINSEQQSY